MILSKGCGCNTAGTVNGSTTCNAGGECDCKNTFFGIKCAEGILYIEHTVQFYIFQLASNLPFQIFNKIRIWHFHSNSIYKHLF